MTVRRRGWSDWRSRQHRARDRGSGSVLGLALVGVVLVVAAVLALLAGAQGARWKAQSAADLAALAGAGALLDPPLLDPPGIEAGTGQDVGRVDACAVAAEAASRNGARLRQCTQDPGGVVRVVATRASPGGTATAWARAGPVSAR